MANRNILIIAFIFIFSHCFINLDLSLRWPPPCSRRWGISFFAFLSLLFDVTSFFLKINNCFIIKKPEFKFLIQFTSFTIFWFFSYHYLYKN